MLHMQVMVELLNSLQEQVYKELKSYDMVQESPYADSVFDRFLWSPGSATANDVFSVNI